MDSTKVKERTAAECISYSRRLAERLKAESPTAHPTLDYIDRWLVRSWEYADVTLKYVINGNAAFALQADPGDYPSRMGSGAIPTRRSIADIPTRLAYSLCLPGHWIDDTLMLISEDNAPTSLAVVLRDSNVWESLVDEFWIMAGLQEHCKVTGESPMDVRARFNVIVTDMFVANRSENHQVADVEFTVRAEPK